MKIDPPRPLTAPERRMLDLVLSAEFPGVHDLREQVKSTVVVGACDCGCPSVDLRAGTSSLPARLASRLLPYELEIVPAGDEPPGQVIVFADDGRLSYLEYVFFGETPSGWPDPSKVRLNGPLRRR